MSIHISAAKGQIAPIVLFPGDPLRAKFIAETFLEGAKCYNEVRGMLGFTGTYKGHQISVQGSGMGMPSAMIYATELFDFYGVKKLIRVGTAGAIHASLKLRDVVIASSACTTSAVNTTRFFGYDYAPTADFDLLNKAYEEAKKVEGVTVKVGSVLSADQFYGHDEGLSARFAEYGVLAVEMEAAGIYTLAPKFGAQALAIMTISDHILTGEETTAQERERTFADMINIALEAAIRD